MGRSEVILVTGANSCVGQHVISALQSRYEHVASIRTLDPLTLYTKRMCKLLNQANVLIRVYALA